MQSLLQHGTFFAGMAGIALLGVAAMVAAMPEWRAPSMRRTSSELQSASAADCRGSGSAQARLSTTKEPAGEGVREWMTAQCRRIVCEWSCETLQHREVEVPLGLREPRSVWVEVPLDMPLQTARALYRHALATVRKSLRLKSCSAHAESAVARAALHELFVLHAGEVPSKITQRDAYLEVERGAYTLRFKSGRHSSAAQQFHFLCWTSNLAVPKP